MRKIAFDYGDVRIGVALSDTMGIIASGLETYKRTKNDDYDMRHLAKLAEDNKCDTIVIGLPINMNGTDGVRVDIVKEFGNRLAKYTSIPIVYVDERLSTVCAEKNLIEQGVRREKRKDVIDTVAATYILRTYLDRIS